MSGGFGYIFEIDPKLMAASTICNFVCQYMINKEFIPILRKRDKRSAIINLASSGAVILFPCVGIYPSTKHLTDIYTRTLAIENSENIDILSARPFGVSTPLMKMRKGERLITLY